MLTVGSRLTDFPTASQSLFENPDVLFASINVNDCRRPASLGATGIVGRRQAGLAALAAALAGHTSRAGLAGPGPRPPADWAPIRAAALDPDTPFDRATIPADFGDIVPDTGALLTQGPGHRPDAGARPGRRHDRRRRRGGPPGDMQKVWDATEGRYAHLEFGFSCMGYEIPGRRWASGSPTPNPDLPGGGRSSATAPSSCRPPSWSPPRRRHRRHLRGDPGEPRLPGDPPAADGPPRHRVRQRVPLPHRPPPPDLRPTSPNRLAAAGRRLPAGRPRAGRPGARRPRGIRANTAAEVRAALDETRGHQGPVVIVVPVGPAYRPARRRRGWDVAPSEVSGRTRPSSGLRTEYECSVAVAAVARLTNSAHGDGSLWTNAATTPAPSPFRFSPLLLLLLRKVEFQ